jgi:hypothetical protein
MAPVMSWREFFWINLLGNGHLENQGLGKNSIKMNLMGDKFKRWEVIGTCSISYPLLDFDTMTVNTLFTQKFIIVNCIAILKTRKKIFQNCGNDEAFMFSPNQFFNYVSFQCCLKSLYLSPHNTTKAIIYLQRDNLRVPLYNRYHTSCRRVLPQFYSENNRNHNSISTTVWFPRWWA